MASYSLVAREKLLRSVPLLMFLLFAVPGWTTVRPSEASYCVKDTGMYVVATLQDEIFFAQILHDRLAGRLLECLLIFLNFEVLSHRTDEKGFSTLRKESSVSNAHVLVSLINISQQTKEFWVSIFGCVQF